MVSILLVEDEPKVTKFIKKSLSLEGWHVETTSTGESCLRRLAKKRYDLVILDIRLPGINGFKVCRRLRRKGRQVPILMLTVRNSLKDKVKGLNLGADDYLTKPFELAELSARIKNILRRKKPPKKLKIANLSLDLGKNSLSRGQHQIKLTPKEFKLLKFLMKNKNKTLSRKQISRAVWQKKDVRKLVNVTIFSLRKKIASGFKKKLIKNVCSKGYKIED